MIKTKKLAFLCGFMLLVMYYSKFNSDVILLETIVETDRILTKAKKNTNMKYILQWTKSYAEPFVFMGKGQNGFVSRRCKFANCYVTSNRTYLNSLKDFDAVLFHGPELSTAENSVLLRLPTRRSRKQKYVFVSKESSRMYPLRYTVYNSFFNWTWTYRLDSDIYYGDIVIKNKRGDVIGPKEVMQWFRVEEMEPIKDELKEKLKNKKIAAAWFVSNCKTMSNRGYVAELLQKALLKYNMTVDIYGRCGNKYCPRTHMEQCLRMLENDYYFYLAFENTVVNDYVTEKLLHALQHYTVPIVYGGANYTRFMPGGSHLNVLNQTIEVLVKRMVDMINDKEQYYEYFKWRNHYSYHNGEESPATDYYCDFCKKLNDFNLMNRTSYIENFKGWWNTKLESN
nr:alpha-(1,3)-fucosyltransferase C [Helicoverpa armigera]